MGTPLIAANAQQVPSNMRPSAQMMPDGTKVVQDVDGTTIEIKPYGTKYVKNADGTTFELKLGS